MTKETGKQRATARAVAVWRWDRGEELPDAQIVVCAPGFGGTPHGDREDQVYALALGIHERGQVVVTPESGGALAEITWDVDAGIIPALHVRRQSDLTVLSSLFAVKARRRAVVVEPLEALDLREVFFEFGHIDRDTRAWIAGGSVRRVRQARPDLVVIAGFAEPLHPDHVREVVEQCRAAQVPVILAGWGEWRPCAAPSLGDWERCMKSTDGEVTRDVSWEDALRSQGGGWAFERVGFERAGCLLDGAEVCDLPPWLETPAP